MPVDVAEQRDRKALHKKERCGALKTVTGIDSPYESPERPENTPKMGATTSSLPAKDIRVGGYAEIFRR